MKEYESERNKLIPEAEAYADKIAGPKKNKKNHYEWSNSWNRAFHSKMNSLAKSLIEDYDLILQELYDSEIHWSIECFRHGGFTAKLGDERNTPKTFPILREAIKWLANQAVKHYPNSTFAAKHS